MPRKGDSRGPHRARRFWRPCYRSAATPSVDPVAAPAETPMKTILTDLDLHLFNEGNHYRIYEKLGSHAVTLDGVAGLHFAVWAPNADRVSVVGDFNQWDGRSHVCEPVASSGIWAIFVPGLDYGEKYKYEVRARAARSCSRPIRTPGGLKCRRDRPRSPGRRRGTSGATPSGSPPGPPAAINSTAPSRSTRCTSDPGGGALATSRPRTGTSPSTSCPT